MTSVYSWRCCLAHAFPRYICVARQHQAVAEARDHYDDPLERLVYVTQRLGNVDSYDWSAIAKALA